MRSSVALAQKPQRVVLCHGVFDILHLGHIRHLQEARNLGDTLVVSVTSDRHVNKGAGRPHFTEAQRIEQLKALECVDNAFVNDSPNAVDVIERLKPAIYVKGIDYLGASNEYLAQEVAAVERHGGEFCVTTTEKWSSSRLLNSERFSDETVAYLESARKRGFAEKITEAFAKADTLRIVFVGESITDVYRYVHALAGKPSKEFILATVETGSESFAGGVLAATKHADWRNVQTITPTQCITKTRFVAQDFNRKLFEVYDRRSLELNTDERGAFRNDLFKAVRDSDALVVFDFGHGLMGYEERQILESGRFVAVNAQTNAANHGFNPISKYNIADFICIDEPEARLATGMQNDPMGDVFTELGRKVLCNRVAITRGNHGCCISGNVTVPPFSSRALDTMGAGDAFLAASAPLIAAGLELEAAAFVGNVAGAIKIGIVGHREHVGRAELVQTIDALLK